MKQAIAGVTPAEVKECTTMTVWPSVVAYPTGTFLGKLYSIRWPDLYIFRLGNLIALASIPHALLLYFCRIFPAIGLKYTLTNRRVVVIKGIKGIEDKSIELDRFDAIEVEVKPGQEWFHAGDLVFKMGGTETFRLVGVSRPEAFRAICMHAHRAYTGVKKALAQELAAAAT
ncbi:MAG: PH domain-containing protein [Planctomycetes bacterium]|nr:PH domain-containing protein [Planctomycetota bacterium]